MSDNVTSDMCAEQRFGQAYTFLQSDQNLHWAYSIAKYAKFVPIDNKD